LRNDRIEAPWVSAFAPMSSSSPSRRSNPTTSSSSTIWAPTKEKPCETPLRPWALASPPVSSQILARPQSDRASLRQAQRLPSKGRAPNAGRHFPRHRPGPRDDPASRMPKLSHRRRICVSLDAEGSRHRTGKIQARRHPLIFGIEST
jgi:hypothetical protein